jgi:hypothetical protein
MGRKRKNITAADRDRWIALWHKNLANDRYEAFIRVHDISSQGNKYRICTEKSNGRSHHLLSYNELLACAMFAYDDTVGRIYDQYLLHPVINTVAIAKELGIKHPRYPGTRAYVAMTSDLVIQYRSGKILAVSVKPESKLSDPRVVEKQLIEEAYWKLQGVEWAQFKDTELRIQPLENVALLLPYWKAEPALTTIIKSWVSAFCAVLIEKPELRTSELIRKASALEGVPDNQGQDFFRHALWKKYLSIDLSLPLLLNKPAIELRLTSNVVY